MRKKKRWSWKKKICLVFFLLLMAYLPLRIILPAIWTGNESLYLAIREGNIERVRELLYEGADPNSTSRGFLWLEGEDGSDASHPHPPVVEAFERDRLDIATLLLEKGADANWSGPRSGITPLMIAAREKKPEAIKLLLENGADVDKRNNRGETALLYAIDSIETDTVKLLLEHNADVNVVTDDGGTVFSYGSDRATEWAKRGEFSKRWMLRASSAQIIEMLKRAGAKGQQ